MNTTSTGSTTIGTIVKKINGGWKIGAFVVACVIAAVGWYEASITDKINAQWEWKVRKEAVDGEIKGLKVHVGEVEQKVDNVDEKIDRYIADQNTKDAAAQARAAKTGELVEKMAERRGIRVED